MACRNVCVISCWRRRFRIFILSYLRFLQGWLLILLSRDIGRRSWDFSFSQGWLRILLSCDVTEVMRFQFLAGVIMNIAVLWRDGGYEISVSRKGDYEYCSLVKCVGGHGTWCSHKGDYEYSCHPRCDVANPGRGTKNSEESTTSTFRTLFCSVEYCKQSFLTKRELRLPNYKTSFSPKEIREI